MGLIFVVLVMMAYFLFSKALIPAFVEYFPYLFAAAVAATLSFIMKIYDKLSYRGAQVIAATTATISVLLTLLMYDSLLAVGLRQKQETGAPVPGLLSNSIELLTSNVTKTIAGVILTSVLVVTVFYKDQARDPEAALAWRQKMRPKFEAYRNRALQIIFILFAFLLFNRLVDGK